MDRTTAILLRLIALGLGNDVEFDIPLEGVDWQAVIDRASECGLDAIAFDGVSALYKRCPKIAEALDESLGDTRFDWMSFTLQAEQDYDSYRNKLQELATFYNAEKLPVMVIKGYGLSLDYPTPAHRPTGDIDLYLFGRGAEADERVKQKLGITVNQEGDKHSRFRFQRLSVENHATFLNVAGHRTLQPIELFLEQEALKASEVPVGDAKICVPPTMFNAVFLPCHLAAHFLYEGIPLKQLVDWAVFLDRHGSEVDWNAVRLMAEDAGRFEFFRALNRIVVSHFGVPAESLPDWGCNPELEERVWKDILLPQKDLAARSLVERFLDYFRNRWKFRLVFRENFSIHFARHLWAFLRGKFFPKAKNVWE